MNLYASAESTGSGDGRDSGEPAKRRSPTKGKKAHRRINSPPKKRGPKVCLPPPSAEQLERARIDNQRTSQAPPQQALVKPGTAVNLALKPTQTALHLRLIERFLIMGKRGGQIIEAAQKEHGVNIDPALFWDYVERIREKWEREDRLLRPIWRERQLRKLHDVCERLEQNELWQPWIQIQKMIAEIEGNYAPIKVEARAADPFEGWTTEELQLFVESGERPRRLTKAVIDVEPDDPSPGRR